MRTERKTSLRTDFWQKPIAQRIQAIGSNINSQLKKKANNLIDFSWFLLFIWGVNTEFEVTKELSWMCSLHGTSTGKNSIKEAEKTLSTTWSGVCWDVLQVMVVKIMQGAEKALVSQTNKACENKVFKPIVIHCIFKVPTSAGIL